VPAWLIVSTAFWLWTPRFLLHGKIGLRLGPWLNEDGKRFG
jgi:hypothetical protein